MAIPCSSVLLLAAFLAMSVRGRGASFAAAGAGAREGASLTVMVQRTDDPAGAAVLPWSLVAGSAGAGSDYGGPLSGVLDFPAGASEAALVIPTTGDSLEEPDEAFTLWMRPHPGDSITAPWGLLDSLSAAASAGVTRVIWAAGDSLAAAGAAAPAPVGAALKVWRSNGTGPGEPWLPVPAPPLPAALQGATEYSCSQIVCSGADLVCHIHATVPGHPEGWVNALVFFRYNLTTAAWEPSQALEAYFPGAVALAGDYLAAGYPSALGGGGLGSGQVYTYKRTGGVWQYEAAINGATVPALLHVSRIGGDLALAGNRLLLGNGYGNYLLEHTPGLAWQMKKDLGPGSTGAFDGDSLLLAYGGIEYRRQHQGGADAWGIAASGPYEGSIRKLWRSGAAWFSLTENGLYTVRRLHESSPGQITTAEVITAWTEEPLVSSSERGFLLAPQPTAAVSTPAQWFHPAALPLHIYDDDGVSVIPVGGTHREDDNGGRLRFDLQLKRAYAIPVRVQVQTVPGTAQAGADFLPEDREVIIPAGHLSLPVEVQVVADGEVEPSETLSLRVLMLDPPGAPAVAEAVIADDDVPRVEPAAMTVSEGDSGSNPVVLPFTLSAPAAQALAIPARYGGTAANPLDYTAAPGLLVVPAGGPGGAGEVNVVGDLRNEAAETVFLHLETGASPPMPQLPWLRSTEISIPGETVQISRVRRAGGHALAIFADVERRIVELQPDGRLTATALSGLPAAARTRYSVTASEEALAAVWTTNTGAPPRSLAIWNRLGNGWSPARILLPAGTHSSLDDVTVQNGWAAARAGNSLFTFHRHAGGTNAWGQVSSLFLPQSSWSNIVGMVSGRDWIALLRSAGPGSEILIFAKSPDSSMPWSLEKTLRPGAIPGARTYEKMLADEDSLAVEEESSSGLGLGIAILQRDAGGPGQWNVVGSIPGEYLRDFTRDGCLTAGTYYRNPGSPGPWEPSPVSLETISGFVAASLLGGTIAVVSESGGAPPLHRVTAFEQAHSVLTIADDDPLPHFSLNDVTLSEGSALPVMPVTITGSGGFGTAYTLAAESGTALAERDFTTPPGATFGFLTIPVPLLNDNLMEAPEHFTLRLLTTGRGKIIRGSARVTILDDDLDPARSTVLRAAAAPSRALVPTLATWSPAWIQPAFDHTAWLSGAGGIGYDRDSPGPATYHSLIGFNVQSVLYNVNTSLLLRCPFELAAVPTSGYLLLRTRHDDGFAAWLNGNSLGDSGNVTFPLAWNSTCPTAPVEPAETIVQLPVSAAQLVAGANLLAIQAINTGVASSDFLMVPELYHTRPWPQPYHDWITQWSAGLSHANYAPGADADLDGVANLLEWLAGTPGGSAGAADALSIKIEEGEPVLFVTLAATLPAGFSGMIESALTADAAQWEESAVLTGGIWTGLTPEEPETVGDTRLRWRFRGIAGPKRFFRLRALLQEL